jgi:hypothetical protein
MRHFRYTSPVELTLSIVFYMYVYGKNGCTDCIEACGRRGCCVAAGGGRAGRGLLLEPTVGGRRSLLRKKGPITPHPASRGLGGR